MTHKEIEDALEWLEQWSFSTPKGKRVKKTIRTALTQLLSTTPDEVNDDRE